MDNFVEIDMGGLFQTAIMKVHQTCAEEYENEKSILNSELRQLITFLGLLFIIFLIVMVGLIIAGNHH